MNRKRTIWYLRENPYQDFNYGNREEVPRITEKNTEVEKNYREYLKTIKTRRGAGRKVVQNVQT